jgi:hypothetical protein
MATTRLPCASGLAPIDRLLGDCRDPWYDWRARRYHLLDRLCRHVGATGGRRGARIVDRLPHETAPLAGHKSAPTNAPPISELSPARQRKRHRNAWGNEETRRVPPKRNPAVGAVSYTISRNSHELARCAAERL